MMREEHFLYVKVKEITHIKTISYSYFEINI